MRDLEEQQITNEPSYLPLIQKESTNYQYQMRPININLSPKGNLQVYHLLNIINGLMNTCGGVVVLIPEEVVDEDVKSIVTKWLDQLRTFVGRCSDSDVVHLIDFRQRQVSDHNSANVLIELSVKPSSTIKWLPYNDELRYVVQIDGTFHQVKKQDDSERPINENQPRDRHATNSQVRKAFAKETQSKESIDRVLKHMNTLSITQKHKKPYEDYIEAVTTEIQNPNEDMAQLFESVSSLPVVPSLASLPQNLQTAVEDVLGKYREQHGFRLWFHSLTEIISSDVEESPENHVYMLCFLGDTTEFHLWSIYATMDQDDRVSYSLNHTARNLKWKLTEILRELDLLKCPNGSLCINISCYTNRAEPDESCTSAQNTFLVSPGGKESNERLCLALKNVMLAHNWNKHMQNTLQDKSFFSLTYAQSSYLTDFGKHNLNFIEGPPGSGKSIVASFLCDLSISKYDSTPFYICTSKPHQNLLNTRKNCHPEVVATDEDLLETLKGNSDLRNAKCVFVDDAQNIEWTEKAWRHLFETIHKLGQILYILADYRYQNFKTKTISNICLQDRLCDFSKRHRIGLNTSYLTDVHRNCRKSVSFIGAGIATTIRCANPVDGDDVKIIHKQNLLSSDSDNGLLDIIRSVLTTYEPSQIAIMIDSDKSVNDISNIKCSIIESKDLKCNVHGAEIFPRSGIIVDLLENFVSLDSTVCIFPILKNNDQHRNLANPRYRAFVASRAVRCLILVQEDELDHSVAELFKLEAGKYV